MTKLTVRDVMDPHPVTVTTRTPFKELAAVLSGGGLGAVLVVGPHGEVAGIVTEADLVRKQGLQFAPRPAPRVYRARWYRAFGDSAGEVMTTRPATIRPEAPIAAAARLMDRNHCGFLPVTDTSGQLVGTVAARDLLRVFLRPDGQVARDIAREIEAGGFAAAPGSVNIDVADGVVTVSGQVRCKSMLPTVHALISGTDGVVNVEGSLTYAVDDIRTVPAGVRR